MMPRQANSVAAGPANAIGAEQAYVDMLYRLLDEARDRTDRGLTQTLGSGGAGGTFQARVERDFTAAEQSRRLAQLNAVEHGLCFGRIDLAAEASGGHGGDQGFVPPKAAELRSPLATARARCTSAGSACATTSTSRGSSTGAPPRPTPSTPPPPATRTG